MNLTFRFPQRDRNKDAKENVTIFEVKALTIGVKRSEKHDSNAGDFMSLPSFARE